MSIREFPVPELGSKTVSGHVLQSVSGSQYPKKGAAGTSGSSGNMTNSVRSEKLLHIESTITEDDPYITILKKL